MGDNTGSDNECSGSEEETYSSDNRDSDRSDDGRRKVSNENAAKMSRKRPYDDDDDDAAEQFRAKRTARNRDVVFRVVVPSHEIGKVIGKQGAKIKVLREETGAKIKIADPVAPQEERVIIISSKDEEKEEKSSAEHALIRIITAILEESGGSANRTKAKAVSRHVGPNMTRLLIAGSQAGSLIGMSGNTIKKIRNDSGASVQVMPQNLLPFCASASETDRLVQISGELSQVLKALDHIGSTLRENPPKEVISMRPTYYVAPSTSNRLMLFPRSALPRNIMQSGNFSSPHSRAAGKAVRGASTISGASASRVTFEITIPSDVVGGLIGKGGSNISRVRSLSGAIVKITGDKDFETRTIYFEGTSDQVAIAQNLVNSFIDAQQQT